MVIKISHKTISKSRPTHSNDRLLFVLHSQKKRCQQKRKSQNRDPVFLFFKFEMFQAIRLANRDSKPDVYRKNE
jgi:hypothetical protein